MPTQPAVIRACYIIECPGHGARETWFFAQSSNSLDAAVNSWSPTIESRRVLLGAQATLKAIELSVETDTNGDPVPGDSVISYVQQDGFSTEDLADPQLALLIKAQTVDRNKRRNAYLRCIWDSIEIKGGRYIAPPGSTWQTKMNNFKAKLVGLGVGYLQSTRLAQVPIALYAQLEEGQVDITFSSAIFAAKPVGSKQKIRIYTARQPSQLSGQQIVIVTSPTSCKTVAKIAVLPFTGVGWTGSLYTYAFSVTPILDDQKIVERHIGRPLLEPVGRRKARARV